MEDPEGRYVLVFNGEIYNYLELRRELEERGVRFRTQGDTEVLLAAYVADGPACLDRLNGMFAFAVWDRREKVLFAARDRLGVKPFFYARGADGLFAFASELQALRGLPLDFTLRARALVEYLRHGFIRSPDTIFRGVHELRPAHCLHFGPAGLRVRRYWEPPATDPSLRERPMGGLAEELRELFRSAVRLRLRSDVPLGAFLSGGLDSSAVVATMRDLGESEIHTFAIGFEEESFDESPYARRVADHLGSIHHEAHASLRAADLLFDLVRHYGQPYGDASAIPTWHLCRETRRHVTVALSGDGGDELFCGYRRYVARRLLERYQRLPRAVRRGLVPALVRHLPEGTSYHDSSLAKKLRLFVALDERVTSDPEDAYPDHFGSDGLSRLLDPTLHRSESAKELLVRRTTLGPIAYLMEADQLHYLPDDILTKVDRASMAHALEVRSPFLDYRVVEFANRLPLEWKLRGLTTKYLLRKAFADDLPREPLTRKKHGFAVPLGDWFQGPLVGTFREIVLQQPGPDYLEKAEVARLLHEHQKGRVDHGYRLWLILFLHAWHHWWHST
jgi:asparagine synthase (glutamine-hydrolysing)